jgi:hypothetical protein
LKQQIIQGEHKTQKYQNCPDNRAVKTNHTRARASAAPIVSPQESTAGQDWKTYHRGVRKVKYMPETSSN